MSVTPHSLKAEKSALGACLLEGGAAGLAADFLEVLDFYDTKHQRIFEGIVEVLEQGGEPDPVLVGNLLEAKGTLEEIGGHDYLDALAHDVPSAANLERYMGIIKERATLRRVADACTDTLGEIRAPGDAQLLIERAADRMTEAVAVSEKTEAVLIGDALHEAMAEIEDRHKNPSTVWGLATGLQSYDSRTGGLHGSQTVIIAAYTSVGKTALALTWLDSICIENQHPALYFTLEMPASDLIRRFVAMRADVTFYELCSGTFHAGKWDSILQAFSEIEGAPLWIDHTPAVSLSQVASRSRDLQARKDVKLVVVDYLQIMSTTKEKSRERQVARLSMGLKTLARELHIPVIVLSQFSRPPKDQPDRFPRLSDLRDSGSLEQDADVVVILHRKRLGDQVLGNKTSMNIAKQRNGVTDTVGITFLPRRIRFMDEAKEPEQQELGAG